MGGAKPRLGEPSSWSSQDSGADAESCHDEVVQGAPEDAVRHRKTSDEDDLQNQPSIP